MQQNNSVQELVIGGLVPVTTIDYPEHLSAVIFCQGCCWRCPYCHNYEILDSSVRIPGSPTWEDVLAFLDKRKGLLDAVVFSGGEPLLQPFISTAIKQVRSRGFSVALHTNGYNPTLLRTILPDIEWVGIDIKAPFSDYYKAISSSSSDWEKVKRHNFGNKVKESLDILLESGISFEARTTLDPRVISKAMLKSLAKELSSRGVHTYAIQEYRKTDTSSEQPSSSDISSFFTDKELIEELRCLFPEFIVRRG